MAYIIEDVISRARHAVQDKEPEFRYEDDLYVNYINDAIYEIRRLRPDLFIASDGVVTDVTIDALDSPFPIDGQYFTAVTDYVAGKIALEDDKFAPEGKAVMLLAAFQTKLVGKI